MANFLSVFSVILQATPGILALISSILASIAQAQGQGGSGPAKLEHAMNSTTQSAPVIVGLIEKQSGKKVTDQTMFAEGTRDLTNALVKVLNSFDALKTKHE